ncbi:MAG TPA: hypothetical protein VN253_02605 [Kofleriaceae bacterium]|nr:hypothetical protein [Kofleriaceae bacterium]
MIELERRRDRAQRRDDLAAASRHVHEGARIEIIEAVRVELIEQVRARAVSIVSNPERADLCETRMAHTLERDSTAVEDRAPQRADVDDRSSYLVG